MSQHITHAVYLVPSDKEPVAEERIRKAMRDATAWLRHQMGNRKTITLNNPIVTVCRTVHDSEWYSTFLQEPNMPHSEIYWANAQLDARDYAGVTFYQENDDYVVYLDADPAPDQHAGGASIGGQGLCVLTGRDVRALMGQDPQWTVCREIGGMIHEMLHTFGRPHPPPGPDFGRAVMGTGYMIYPDCILTEQDKLELDLNRFFGPRPRLPKSDLCPFNDSPRPIPAPRPRPLPYPR